MVCFTDSTLHYTYHIFEYLLYFNIQTEYFDLSHSALFICLYFFNVFHDGVVWVELSVDPMIYRFLQTNICDSPLNEQWILGKCTVQLLWFTIFTIIFYGHYWYFGCFYSLPKTKYFILKIFKAAGTLSFFLDILDIWGEKFCIS
jgi:hypothetical protein